MCQYAIPSLLTQAQNHTIWFCSQIRYACCAEKHILLVYAKKARKSLVGRPVLCPKFTKIFVRRGFTPDPTGGANDAPADPLLGWGEASPLPNTLPYTVLCITALLFSLRA